MKNSYRSEYPHYLVDRPVGIDKFEGGSQNKLSESISEYIIATDSEENIINGKNDIHKNSILPKIIGIEGSWGTGKSNVIEIMKGLLCSENKKIESGFSYTFFIYDAWSNQEDLQRRSILEQLTSFLINGEIISGSAPFPLKEQVPEEDNELTWQVALKRLLAHERITTYKQFPKTNVYFYITALLALIIPAMASVSSSLKDSLPFWIRLLIALSPIIAFFIMWIIALFLDKNNASISHLLALYTGKIRNDETYEIISDNEPNVMDFRRWIKIISNAIGEKKKKLVIVIDNMDRLPANKVKQLWSSIHTLFSEDDMDEFKNIWVIIPYDFEHLKCAFSNDQYFSKEQDGKQDVNSITRYFLEKTFPITFVVPEPIITDYAAIFQKFYKEAFGDTQDNSLEQISRIYRLSNEQANVREIIHFINRLVSIYKSRKNDNISLECMAVYVIYERQLREKTDESILSGSFLNKVKNIVTYDDEFKEQLTALIYGIDQKMAEQIPLTGYLKECIRGNANSDINKFSSNKGFDCVLNKLCDECDDAEIPDLVLALDKLEKKSSSVEMIWSTLSNRIIAILNQSYYANKEIDLPEYIVKLFHHINETQTATIANQLYDFWYIRNPFDIEKYISNIDKLNNATGKLLISLKDKEVGAAELFNVVRIKKENYSYYHLKASPKDIDEYFTDKLLSEQNFSEFRILFNDRCSDFSDTLVKIRESFEQKKITFENFGNVINIYKELANQEEVKKVLISYPSIDQIEEALKDKNKLKQSDGYPDAAIVSIINRFNFIMPDSALSEVAGQIEYYIQINDFLINGLNSNYCINLGTFIIKNKIGANVNVKEILKYFSRICTKYKVDNQILYDYLVSKIQTISFDEIHDLDSLIVQIPDTVVFKCSANKKDILSNTILSAFSDVLDNSDYSQRIFDERNNSLSYLQIAINYVIDDDVFTNLPLSLNKYCELIYKDIATGKITETIRKITEVEKKLLAKSNCGKSDHIFIDIRNEFTSGNISISKFSFVSLEEKLRLYGSLEEQADSVIYKILEPVVSDDECKSVILKSKDYYKKLISRSKPETKEILVKKLFESNWTENEIAEIVDSSRTDNNTLNSK